MNTGSFMNGLVPGISYNTGGSYRTIEADGRFYYYDGDYITFFIGDTPIGTSKGKTNITPLDFYMQAQRQEPQYSDFCVLNTSRILLAAAGKGEKVVKELGLIWAKLDVFDEPEDFEKSTVVKDFLKSVSATLPSCEKTRNTIRRCDNNIHAEYGVRIPLKDGRHLNCNIYRPIVSNEPVPVVMSMGAFGSGFINGFRTTDTEDLLEQAEDRFFNESNRLETQRFLKGVFIKRMLPCVLGSLPLPNKKNAGKTPKPISPKQLATIEKVAGKLVVGKLIKGQKPSVPIELPKITPASSSFEEPSPEFWVPRGYAVIHVEEFGLGENGGDFKSFGARNAHDYCEAIEWASNLPWTNGKVGLFGASYYAMTQYTAAQHHPKGLCAMIPIMGDADSYRDYNYSGGGLYNRAENFDPSWPKQDYSNLDYAVDHPFLSEEDYGPEAPFCCSADMSKVDCPIWGVLEPMTTLHSKGTSEAYIRSASKEKKLSVILSQGIHFWMYSEAVMEDFCRFFDRWLKDADNGIMDEPRVSIQLATGNGSYRMRAADDWPVPGTSYIKFYLSEGSKLSTVPGSDGKTSYSADVKFEDWKNSGTVYVSEPLEEELEIAGNAMARFYASSTTDDMELHISVSVLNEDGSEIKYNSPAHVDPRPVITGAAKASHRMLDNELSRQDCPVFIHTKEACKKLKPNEIVDCPVGTFPTAFVAPKGSRLILRVYPVDPVFVGYDCYSYRSGATNTIYHGVSHPSYLQIPVINS